MRRRDGFTLIEMLVVMLVIAILATALIIALVKLVERSKYDRVIAQIKVLSDACEVYRTEMKVYPPDTTYSGSANLHWYLGQEFMAVERYGSNGQPDIRKRHLPYVEFKRDWLMGNPSVTDPSPSPLQIVDVFSNTLTYAIDAPLTPGQPPAGVTILSAGVDKTPSTSDDVSNKVRE